MNSDIILVIIATIPGALMAIPGIIALRSQYLKEKAETEKETANASSINVDTSLKLMKKLETKYDKITTRVDTMEAEIIKQESEIKTLRNRVQVLSNYADALIKQIIDIGIKPVVTLAEIKEV